MRAKDQGTAEETRQKNLLISRGHKAVRLSEGGVYDQGDLGVTVRGVGKILVESKHRQNLNPFKAVKKALEKSLNGTDTWDLVVLWWKRTIKKEGNERRSQEGPPLVIMAEDDFLHLLDLLASPRKPVRFENIEEHSLHSDIRDASLLDAL